MPPEPQARPLPEGPVDLDAQATSPLRPEALAAMLPWLDGPDGAELGDLQEAQCYRALEA